MAEPTRRTQQERSETTRSLLLDATIESLIDVGYAATTTTEIARRAGVSRGAQLHHYPAKADLVSAALEQLARRLGSSLQEEAALLSDDPVVARNGIEALWARYTGPLFQAWLELWVAARTDSELRAALGPLELRLRDRVVAQLVHLFPTSAEPDLNDVSAALAATMYMLQGMALEHTLSVGEGRSRDERSTLDLCAQLLARHITNSPA